MGVDEVQGFLSMLANERHVSASTHKQALSALLFLYREVLGLSLPWMDEALALRIKDLAFERNAIIVRDGKGFKDRVVMLPASLRDLLLHQREAAHQAWQRDRETQRGGVSLHTLRHSFATHVLKVAAGGVASPLDALAG